MNQARFARRMSRRLMKDEARRWLFREKPFEKQWCQELDAMPRVLVRKLPPSMMRFIGTEVRNCHKNAMLITSLVPGVEAVLGWIVAGSRYVAHSVVRVGDYYLCVTPFVSEGMQEFEFVVDPLIIRDDAGYLVRCGEHIPMGVRRDPAEFISEARRYIASPAKYGY